MSSTLLEQYRHALGEFGSRVEQVGGDQWSAPTPCSKWDVRTLVAHVADEQRWVPYLLEGGRTDEAGDRFAGDPLGDDPKRAWQELSSTAAAAFEAEDALERSVHLSYGEASARDYLWQMTVDLAVHAWDLARGTGADEHLDPELVRRIHHETDKDAGALAESGLFDPPVRVASTSDLQTRMLALFGRRS